MGIILDRQTVGALALAEGKTDQLFMDSVTTGFGYRLRIGHDGKLMRSFFVQYRLGNQQRRQKIKVTDPDKARKEATKLLNKVAEGIDPAAEKDAERAATALTFSKAAEQYLELKKLQVRNNSLRVSTLYLTGPKYFASLHKMPLAKITQSHVSTRLNAILVASGAPTAGQARKHLSAFFVWCMRQGHCPLNPVLNTEAVKSGSGRERVLNDDELRKVWNVCQDDDLGRIVKLLMLTGCRCSEIGGLRWSEIDLDKGAISLPAERTKNGRAHTLTLPEMAVKIIKDIPQRVTRDHLFGSRANGFTSWAKQHSMGDGLTEHWTLHDIRRSVATGMAEHNIAEPHIIEALLNHASGHKGGIAGIYNRAQYAKQMTRALALWAEHIASIVERGPRKLLTFPQSA